MLPYIEASQSGVLNLAFNFCLPAVVTDVGSLPEVIRNGVNGLVVSSHDPVALAHAVCVLLKDVELRTTVINNLKIDRATIHDRKSIAIQTRYVYEACMTEVRL